MQISKKNRNFAPEMIVREQITVFDAITRQILSGTWTISLALYTKAQTLDRYYHIYQLLNEYEPERARGYRARFCYNLQICSTLWGGYLENGEVLDIDTLKHAVAEMERIIWV